MNEKCFAMGYKGCRILTLEYARKCPGKSCPFYKTEEENQKQIEYCKKRCERLNIPYGVGMKTDYNVDHWED